MYFLFLYYHCVGFKEFTPILYIAIEKINPQEFPRNPVISGKIKRQENFDVAQFFLKRVQKTLNEQSH